MSSTIVIVLMFLMFYIWIYMQVQSTRARYCGYYYIIIEHAAIPNIKSGFPNLVHLSN